MTHKAAIQSRPNPALVQGYRASQAGVVKSRNPYRPDDPNNARWDMGWSIAFYGEELPGVR